MSITKSGKRIGMAAHIERRELMNEIQEAAENQRDETNMMCKFIASMLTDEDFQVWVDSCPDDNNGFYKATKEKYNELQYTNKDIDTGLDALESIGGEDMTHNQALDASEAIYLSNDLIPTGEIPDSKCPNCGSALRVNNKREYMRLEHNRQFVGCMNYPKCGYIAKKISMDVVVKMRRVQAERETEPVEF